MKNFISVSDVGDPKWLVDKVLDIKTNPFMESDLGKNKVLGLVFFNSSLRTRMSTTRAAYNLGMQVITLNVSSDSWQLEMADGVVMDQGKAEHAKDAIPVMSAYCDIIGVRSFPGLEDRQADYSENVLTMFTRYSKCPVVNLESATLHPLQSLTDLVTIKELRKTDHPKVVLTWAPHIKPLPQSVANSFAQWMQMTDYEFVVTYPPGLELADQFAGDIMTELDQEKALQDADFVYCKNWSSYQNYGKYVDHPEWLISSDKMALTNDAFFMHCMPIRRNVVASDSVLDSKSCVIQQQAENRLYAAQAVLSELLKSEA